MQTKHPFIPGFLDKLDQRWLKNHPVSWSSRILPAVFYGGLFAALLAIICFIVPADPRNSSRIYYWIILIGVISLLAFIFWMILLLRFNVFKRFGKWRGSDTLKTFLFYFFGTFIIVSWPFIPPVIESVRANAAYSSEELVQDVNAMNIKICQLERDSVSTKFVSDTFQINNSTNGTALKVTGAGENAETGYERYYLTDTATLNDKLGTADSVKKVNDSVYIIYTCPRYTYIYQHRRGAYFFANSPQPKHVQLVTSKPFALSVIHTPS